MASFFGLLWVDRDSIPEIIDRLQRCRDHNDYHRKMHFIKLNNNYKKRKMANEWFRISINLLRNRMRFYVFFVDRISRGFDCTRFPKRFHEYNRFTAIALHTSFRWFFIRDAPKVDLSFFSDGKIDRPGTDVDKTGDGIESDNFEQYLKARFQNDLKDKSHEITNMDVVKIQVPREPENGKFSDEEELLQLTDLLIGSSRQAFIPECTYGKCTQIRRDLGRRMWKIIEDVDKPPWEQKFGLYKRFGYGIFPGETGRMTKQKARSAESCRKLTDFL